MPFSRPGQSFDKRQSAEQIIRYSRTMLRPHLNYHHLAYFQAVARAGGVAAASRRLGVGSPAISAQVRALERALGVRLFERVGRRLELTEEGRLALVYADEIFAAGVELLDAFAAGRPGVASSSGWGSPT